MALSLGVGGGVTVWSEPSHIILKLYGYTLDHISEKVLCGLCDIRIPRHFEPGLLATWGRFFPRLIVLVTIVPAAIVQVI